MKFNIKVERVRSRWFHRKVNREEKLRRNLDEIFDRFQRDMERQHEEFKKWMDDMEKIKK